jgi:hypothetical protein
MMNHVAHGGMQDSLVALHVSLVTAQHHQFLHWSRRELDNMTVKNRYSPANHGAGYLHDFCILTAILLMLDHSVRHFSHLDARKFVEI